MGNRAVPAPPAAAVPVSAQTKPDEATIALDVTAKRLDRERSSILPSLDATRYDFGKTAIQNTPRGENATLNMPLTQKVPIAVNKGTQVRFDAINLADSTYQIRDGTGVGVGAPQFGMRRAFFVTLSQKF